MSRVFLNITLLLIAYIDTQNTIVAIYLRNVNKNSEIVFNAESANN